MNTHRHGAKTDHERRSNLTGIKLIIITTKPYPGKLVQTTCQHRTKDGRPDCNRLVGHYSKDGTLSKSQYLCERHGGKLG
jgi:hypothetical protein